MQKSYIQWNKLTNDNKPSREGEYLVAIDVGDSIDKTKRACAYDIAKWYNAGTTVFATCSKKTAGVNEKDSREEKFLKLLFAGSVEIPETGFYIMMPFSGNEDEDHPGYYEYPEKIGEIGSGIFWAELPVAPEGYNAPDDEEKLKEIMMDKKQKETEDQLNKTMDEVLAGPAGSALSELNSYLYDRDNSKNGMIEISGYIYEDDEQKKKEAITLSYTIGQALCAIEDEDLIKVLSVNKTKSEIDSTIEKIESVAERVDQYDIRSTRLGPTYMRTIVQVSIHLARRMAKKADRDFTKVNNDLYMNEFTKNSIKYKDLPYEKRYIVATNMLQMDNRFARLIKLLKMGAPDIIANKEFAMCAEKIWYFRENPIGEVNDFASYYGLVMSSESPESMKNEKKDKKNQKKKESDGIDLYRETY